MTDETLIADLIRGGVDPDLVQRVALAIIEAKGTAQVAIMKDESAERRRAADRERKAAFRRNPQTSTESADRTDNPLPLAPSLPLPPQTPPSPAHPHTPTPADTHAPVRENGSQKPKRSTPKPADDEEWLKSLEADPTYAGVAIRVELGKMRRWCEENNQMPSRKRFVNWINRAPRPMNGQHHNGKPRNQAYQGGESATAGKTADQVGNLFGDDHEQP